MKILLKYFTVLFVVVLLAGCGGNKKSSKQTAAKDTTTTVKDTVRKSTHQTDYENFKNKGIPLKKSPEQIIHF